MDANSINIRHDSYQYASKSEMHRNAKGHLVKDEKKPDIEQMTIESVSLTISTKDASPISLEDKKGVSTTSEFNSFTQEVQEKYRDNLIHLSKNGRIFVEDKKTGCYKRATAIDVKHAIEQGKEAALITNAGEVAHTKQSNDFYSSETNGIINYHLAYESSSSKSERYEYVNYSASPITSWSDLDFIDMSEKGVQGVSILPPSGSKALVSMKYEKEFSEEAERTRGLFRVTHEHAGRGQSESIG